MGSRTSARRQDGPQLLNSTCAKATMDCDFSRAYWVAPDGTLVRPHHLIDPLTVHQLARNELEDLANKVDISINETMTNAELVSKLVAVNEHPEGTYSHRAILIACTYHCG